MKYLIRKIKYWYYYFRNLSSRIDHIYRLAALALDIGCELLEIYRGGAYRVVAEEEKPFFPRGVFVYRANFNSNNIRQWSYEMNSAPRLRKQLGYFLDPSIKFYKTYEEALSAFKNQQKENDGKPYL